jgi:hypothetical protein
MAVVGWCPPPPADEATFVSKTTSGVSNFVSEMPVDMTDIAEQR